MTYFTWPGIGPSGIDWEHMNASKAQASGASKNVIKRRDEGTDNSTFKGMSRRSTEMSKKQLPPAMMKAKKKEKT